MKSREDVLLSSCKGCEMAIVSFYHKGVLLAVVAKCLLLNFVTGACWLQWL